MTITYDRHVPTPFVAALAPEGPMHELVELVRSPLGIDKALDLRFRARPGHAGARATLYLGLTQVLHVHWSARGKVKLVGQQGEGFKKSLDPSLFDPAWSRSQELNELTTSWSAVMTYVRAAIEAAPPKYVTTEGRAQARLSRETKRFITVDREVVVSFSDQATKDATLLTTTSPVQAAKKKLSGDRVWARREKSFGTELDALAVDPQGKLLAIEVKHGRDTGGVGWTPAQVAVYLGLMRRWADATPNAAEIINRMLAQYATLGLPGAGMAVSDPVVIRPVIAIAEPIANRLVANERMVEVTAALAAQDIPMEDLEIWVIDGEDELSVVALGDL